MTTENDGSFFAVPSLHPGKITTEPHSHGYALIRFGSRGGDLYLKTADTARQLLAAAFEAVRILDPDGATDTVFALIEGDALAKIRARILEEDAAPEAAKAARIRKLIAEGQVLGIIEPDPADAAPDTAQPEDIPVPACRRCGATDTPLLIGGTCNSALCAERQVAKANVR